MHHFDYGFHVFDRRFLQDAMSEIEDMPGSLGRLIENATHPPFEFSARRQQRHRIEIALHSSIEPDRLPPSIEIDAPVESNHVAASAFHQWQKSCCICAKVN